MKQKLISILQLTVIGASIGILAVYTFFQYTMGYCTDPEIASSNIYVYEADGEFAELNQTYANQKKLVPPDVTRLLTYSDLPDIAAFPGVEGLYIMNDRRFDDIFYQEQSDELIDLAVPEDIITHFADCSGMWNIFMLESGNIPSDQASEIAMPQSWIAENGNPSIGDTIIWHEQEYRLTGIHRNDFAWISFNGSNSFYYTYQSDTYTDFLEEETAYLTQIDGLETMELLILCNEPHSAELQDHLICTYPATNYLSNEFVRAWKQSVNGSFWRKEIVCSIILIFLTILAEAALNHLKE